MLADPRSAEGVSIKLIRLPAHKVSCERSRSFASFAVAEEDSPSEP